MPAATTLAALPYPLSGDVPKVYDDLKKLAEAIDSKLPIAGANPAVGDGQIVYTSTRPPTQEYRAKASGEWRTFITGRDPGDWSLSAIGNNPAVYIRNPASVGNMLVLSDRGIQAKASGASAVSVYINPLGGNIFMGSATTTPFVLDPNGLGLGGASGVVGMHISKAGSRVRIQDGSNYIDIYGSRQINGNAAFDVMQDVNLRGTTATLTVQSGGAGAYAQLSSDTGRGVFYLSGTDYTDIQGNNIYGAGGLNFASNGNIGFTSNVYMTGSGGLGVTGNVSANAFVLTSQPGKYMDSDPGGYLSFVDTASDPDRVLFQARVSGSSPNYHTDFRLLTIPALGALAPIGVFNSGGAPSWQVGTISSTLAIKKDIHSIPASRDLGPGGGGLRPQGGRHAAHRLHR